MTISFQDNKLVVTLVPGDTLVLETPDSLVGTVEIDEYRGGGMFFSKEGEKNSLYMGGGSGV